MGLMPSGPETPYEIGQAKRDWCAQGDGIARPRRAPRSENQLLTAPSI